MEIRLRMAGYSISHVARPCDEDLAPVSLPRGGVQRARNHSSNSAVKQLAEVLSLQDRISVRNFALPACTRRTSCCGQSEISARAPIRKS